MVENPQFPKGKGVMGEEEARAQSLLDLLEPEKAQLKSDLDDEEIHYLAMLRTWAKELDIKTLDDFCNNFMELRVSRNRMGRREIVFALSLVGERIRGGVKSIKDLFSGLRIFIPIAFMFGLTSLLPVFSNHVMVI